MSSYLDSAESRTLLESGGRRPAAKKTFHAPDTAAAAAAPPVQLGSPKEAGAVSRFFELCQEKGVAPVFEVGEDPQDRHAFVGTLTVGGVEVVCERAETSKKDVRQALAVQGYALVRGMEDRRKANGAETAGPEENWVGKLLGMSVLFLGVSSAWFFRGRQSVALCFKVPSLIVAFIPHPLASLGSNPSPYDPIHLPLTGQPHSFSSLYSRTINSIIEYYNASTSASTSTSSAPAPTFTVYASGSRFACTCTIAESPTPFSTPTTFFASKKAAKTHAARLAITHLVATQHLHPDGSIKRPSVNPSRAAAATLSVNKSGAGRSYGERVNELFPVLGFSTPVYELRAVDELAPNVYSGGARLTGVKGLVGEVRHVFGKKRAKEECSKGLWEFLEGVRRERGWRALDGDGAADVEDCGTGGGGGGGKEDGKGQHAGIGDGDEEDEGLGGGIGGVEKLVDLNPDVGVAGGAGRAVELKPRAGWMHLMTGYPETWGSDRARVDGHGIGGQARIGTGTGVGTGIGSGNSNGNGLIDGDENYYSADSDVN